MRIRKGTLPVCMIFIISSVFVISCQKEITERVDDTVDPPPPTVNDSTVLAKFILLDTTLPSGQDTAEIYNYFYDNNKRLVKVVLQDFEVSYDSAWTTTTEYYYNGIDTLPYTSVIKDLDLNNERVIFYQYQNGIVSADSIIDYENGSLYQYHTTFFTDNGNNTSINSRGIIYSILGNPTSFVYSGTVFKTYTNGNITKQIDTASDNNSVTYYDSTIVTYDQKINPFYKVDDHYPMLNGYNESRSHQKNNTTEIKQFWNGSLEWHEKLEYTYRQDGYPTMFRITNFTHPEYSYKGILLYTR